MRYCFLFLVFCLHTGLSGQSDLPVDRLEELFTELAAGDRFNGSVLIAAGEDIIFRRSIGMADFSEGVPNTDQSVYELASVGKQFTAAAIMLLHDRGKLDFDDPVVKYLPALPYPEITLRHLLNHTAGLPNYYEMGVEWPDTVVAANADILAGFARLQPPLLFVPGTQFKYSNTGYVFLASVVSAVTGQPFGAFLRQNIFEPLGMEHTRAYAERWTTGILPENYAFPHRRIDGAFVRPEAAPDTRYVIAMSGIEGDGNIVASLPDLLKWSVALQRGKLFKPATWRAAIRPPELPGGGKSEYGFGWYVERGGDKLWHWGQWPGVQASFSVYPGSGLTAVYVKNVETHDWSWLKDYEKALRRIRRKLPDN